MPRLKTVLYYLAECIRAVAVYIGPTMPSTPARIYEQLGVTDDEPQDLGDPCRSSAA